MNRYCLALIVRASAYGNDTTTALVIVTSSAIECLRLSNSILQIGDWN